MTSEAAFNELLIDLRLREKSLVELQVGALLSASKPTSELGKLADRNTAYRLSHKLEGLRLAIFWTDHHRKMAITEAMGL